MLPPCWQSEERRTIFIIRTEGPVADYLVRLVIVVLADQCQLRIPEPAAVAFVSEHFGLVDDPVDHR